MRHDPPVTGPAGPAGARPVATRGHLQLETEVEGRTPWCGPAVLALATGRSYPEACALLHRVAPERYESTEGVVTTYWRDLLAGLRSARVATQPIEVPMPFAPLLRLVRGGTLAAGWYLMRVTDHFLLLRNHGFGLAEVHDNRHTGAVLGARTHGRRHLTHAVRLLGGPLPALD